METKNLEQVKELIRQIADSYDLPTDEQTKAMRKLTGIDWDAEDLRMMCCGYWESPHTLDELAYFLSRRVSYAYQLPVYQADTRRQKQLNTLTESSYFQPRRRR